MQIKKTTHILLVSIMLLLVTNNKSEAITFGIEYANPAWSQTLDFPRLAKDFANIGVRAIKIQEVMWQQIEPTPPQKGVHRYYWEELDNLIKIFQSEGYTDFEIVLEATSPWGTRTPTFKERIGSSAIQKKFSSLPPKKKHWKDYYDFITNIVERYDGDGINDMPGLKYPVLEYEIETEAQGTYHWIGTSDEYIRLLQTAYKAAKAANPQTKIILSGFGLGDLPTPDPFGIEKRINLIKPKRWILTKMIRKMWRKYIDFSEKLLKNKDFFDVVEFHALDNYKGIYTTVGWIRKVMKSYDYEKPIQAGDAIATPTLVLGPVTPHPHPFSPLNATEIVMILSEKENPMYNEVHSWYRAEQSRLVVKKTVAAMHMGLEKINFGFFTDSPLADTPRVKKMASRYPMGYNWRIAGFLDKNYERYPAYFTYKLTIEKLKDARFVKQLPLEVNNYGFEFSSGGMHIYVLWSEKKTTLNFVVDSSLKTVKVTNIVTKFNQQSPQVEIKEVKNGKVKLNLTLNPLFVEPSSK